MIQSKHTSGHKRGSVGISLGCECGWRSATWFGKGALKGANAEWQTHIENHRAIAKATGGEVDDPVCQCVEPGCAVCDVDGEP